MANNAGQDLYQTYTSMAALTLISKRIEKHKVSSGEKKVAEKL